ncbi:alpha-(1,3)-fucosyltransferase fut-1-like [Watersipora subatra]|uniref:alpha-(1,3)-fucosyltransferase fut-1-like n=1 Tax=Watersipora subatra TaxID=2589382 RepID=UPI00355B7700
MLEGTSTSKKLIALVSITLLTILLYSTTNLSTTQHFHLLVIEGGVKYLHETDEISLKTKQVESESTKDKLVKTSFPVPSREPTRIIYQPTPNDQQAQAFNRMFKDQMDFSQCNYSNCVYTFSHDYTDIVEADVVLIEYRSTIVSKVYGLHRQSQIWIVYSHEPPVLYPWRKVFNYFNGTMTYTRDSTVYWPWGEMKPKVADKQSNPNIDFAQGKTKGAYAYVSHCTSAGYNRLETMKELGQYIEVDIFGGCTHNLPCHRGDINCETSLHSKYKFFLAFENSLCEDYITEKFWKRLHSDGHFVPVVVGGFSIDDYTRVAPPDSFIHAYNFSSIKELGEYLQHLMQDDAAYNRYHEWRKHYMTTDNVLPQTSVCTFCELANNPSTLESHQKALANNWNSKSNCKRLKP